MFPETLRLQVVWHEMFELKSTFEVFKKLDLIKYAEWREEGPF